MATRAETFKKLESVIDTRQAAFTKNISTRSQDMWSTILKTLKKLDVDGNGNILSNTKNLKILRTLREDIKRTIITPQYKKDLERFLKGFDELKGINDTYYKTISAGALNANKFVFKEVLNASTQATKNSLLEAGINNEIIAPVQNVLTQNVTTGASFSDMVENLRVEILGDAERLGGLERYSKQITNDALNQFNANYNVAVSEDLGLEFYFYNGGIKETSRSYCINMVNGGRYYHKKEVEESSKGNWPGKIPGTNESSIFVYRGGYNCGHQWIAVPTIGVPKSVRDRAEKKGYYEP